MYEQRYVGNGNDMVFLHMELSNGEKISATMPRAVAVSVKPGTPLNFPDGSRLTIDKVFVAENRSGKRAKKWKKKV